MAFEDYNKQLVERFETLIAHLDAGERDGAIAVVEQLTSEQFDDDDLPEQLEALRGEGSLEDVRAWAEILLEEIQGMKNPFEEESEFDLDGAFLDLEDTGFRDVAGEVDEDEDLFAALGGGQSFDVASEIALVEGSEDLGDIDEDEEEQEEEKPEDENSGGARHVLSGRFNVPLLKPTAAAPKPEPTDEAAPEASEASEVSDGSEDPDENSMLAVMLESEAYVDQDAAAIVGVGDVSGPVEVVNTFSDLEGVDALSEAESEAASEAVSEADSASEPEPESASGPVSFSESSPSLDFGDLGDFGDFDDDEAEGEEQKPEGGAPGSLEALLAADEPEPADPLRQTRPNVAPDASAMASSRSDADRPYDSGTSQARYASGKEPPPPTHRLRATADISDEIATPVVEMHDDSDSLDFDLGLRSQPAERSVPKPTESDDLLGFDFDFGLDTGEEDKSSNPPTVEAQLDDDSESGATDSGRQREHTPLAPLPAADLENDFFEMAAAMAADSEADHPYRGEPLRPRSNSNPFAHEAPTGTNHPALGDLSQSSVGADGSQVATNFNAILLEARRLKRSGELGAALDITKKVLSRSENRDAEELQREIEEEMEAAHLDTLGPLEQTPRLRVQMGKLSELDLDHRAGFIISQIDGMLTYEDIIELSSMSRTETLGVLTSLLRKGVIEGVS